MIRRIFKAIKDTLRKKGVLSPSEIMILIGITVPTIGILYIPIDLIYTGMYMSCKGTASIILLFYMAMLTIGVIGKLRQQTKEQKNDNLDV